MSELNRMLLFSDSQIIYTFIKGDLSEFLEIQWKKNFSFSQDNASSKLFRFVLIDFNFFKNTNSFLAATDDFYVKKLEEIKSTYLGSKIFILSDSKDVKEAKKLLNFGYENIITPPFSKETLIDLFCVGNGKERSNEVSLKENGHESFNIYDFFTTNNIQFKDILDNLEKISKTKSTILLLGETGTGKSLMAQYIHYMSRRKNNAYVKVHCGAIPETLVESELFGHEKGAFTGALRKKIGKFEQANRGTIFLDEIGTISLDVQVKFLQVLQEKFIQRVGGEELIPLDLRVIAATNSNLKNLIKENKFREDLYYRLNVFTIEIPPLREITEDIPSLCNLFIKKFNKRIGREVSSISDEAISILQQYHWPGNIRELENVLERAYILEASDIITTKNLPAELIKTNREIINIFPIDKSNLTLSEARRIAMNNFEKKYLVNLLSTYKGKVSEMSKEADVTVRQLHKLLSRHNIKTKDYFEESQFA